MSLTSHLTELQRKHEALDTRIEREERRPGSNTLDIGMLKREKLKLKEEIQKIAHQVH